ncbi:aldehyde dehydrogenase family protein [Salisediminibacterium selenitireducens]|uniref:Aldehyde Dehydrogenase n=1 Tax=Bacillus selenitireducens (strain ATCC 700615 / DSM 15326 / MLS10) TaxID=439292 RepID=D6XUS3_BACIE|nr:aldehyde dehydrogenase family protein [Salisediminibacterium selenitireducens]ADH99559.1 Aldehyde Dehydrogenase [[Bacillus] selenitireducens MLS10]
METYKLFINGKWQDADTCEVLYSPFEQDEIGCIPVAGSEETHLAISAAEEAFSSYAALPAYVKSDILSNVATLLKEQREPAARLIAIEAGKPLSAAREEVSRAIMTYTLSAEEARRLPSEQLNMDAVPGGERKTAYVKRKPYGVVGAITPFNFPFNLVAHKIGPAIAAGNTVILKPASQTPLSAFFIADLFHKAGLPDGVLNVITGKGHTTGMQLVRDPRVKIITFTGSEQVGKQLQMEAYEKKLILELGSNSAVIIGDDVDVKQISSKLVKGAFGYQGQVCISVQRIFVQKKNYRSLLKALKQEAEEQVKGSPLDEAVTVSSIISAKEADRIETWVQEAVEKGAEAITQPKREGNIIQPVILTQTTPDMSVNAEEVFGPIVTVEPFETWEEAVQMVNQSRYELQAGVFTNRMDDAFYAAEAIEAGGVHINEIPTYRADHMPYGGVKNSGTGREGVKYAIEEMTARKLITFQSLP